MVSRNVITDLLMIALLIALQIFLFNRLAISGYIPVVYPIFVMFYPFYRNNYIYLFSGFLLGLGIDAFTGTGELMHLPHALSLISEHNYFSLLYPMKLIAFHSSPFSGHSFCFLYLSIFLFINYWYNTLNFLN